MKASTKRNPSFKSISLEIEIESPGELDFFGSLFNHTAVHAAADRFNCPKLDKEINSIYKLLASHGADIHQVVKFNL